MDYGADAGNEELVNALEGHGAFGERDAFHARHFLVGGQQHGNLALDGNAEGVFEERILPGVHVRFFGSEGYVGTFGEGRGFGDGDCFGGAGLDAFAGEAVGRGKAPGAAGNDADADAEGFGLDQGADFTVFGADFALADVHDARVGIGGAAALGRFDCPGGPVLHHAWEFRTAEFAIFMESGRVLRSVHLYRIENRTVIGFERVTAIPDFLWASLTWSGKTVFCFEQVTAMADFPRSSFVSNRNFVVVAGGGTRLGVWSGSWWPSFRKKIMCVF